MKANGPCCTTLSADGSGSWDETRDAAARVGEHEPPPQLMEGMEGVIDIGGITPTEIGKVHTFVHTSVPAPTWTEHWVVQGPDWFTDPTRVTRLVFPRPQPPKKPWSQLEPTYAGWYHAAIVYQYETPPSPAPHLPLGTFAFNVFATGATPAFQGRLFRTAVGNTITDKWVLYPGYIAPNRRSDTELHPIEGDVQQLFEDALAEGGLTAEYVDVTYTVALL